MRCSRKTQWLKKSWVWWLECHPKGRKSLTYGRVLNRYAEIVIFVGEGHDGFHVIREDHR
jgi:hypothetical protein